MNRDKFRKMPFWQKIQWIFQYYGLVMAVAAAALFVGFTFIKTVFGPGEHYDVNIMILDDGCSGDDTDRMFEELTEMTGLKIQVTSYRPSVDTEHQAFAVRLFANDLDLILAPAQESRQLVDNGFLAVSEKLPPDAYYWEVTEREEADGDSIYLGSVTEEVSYEIMQVKSYFSGSELQTVPVVPET